MPSLIGAMSTGDGHGHKKRRVLRNSRPSYQDCWRTDLCRLKALAVNGAGHPADEGRMKDGLPATDLAVLA